MQAVYGWVWGILQATQWAGYPGGGAPDAFRNCTCGLKIWWESHLPVQASNKDSSVQDGEKTGMMRWSSQCWQGHTGGLMSKGPQESVLCHSLACLWHMWLESGVSTEQESCLLQESRLTGKNQAVSSWHYWGKQACLFHPYLTLKIMSNGSKRKR